MNIQGKLKALVGDQAGARAMGLGAAQSTKAVHA